ncbi:MAG: hypothetical protein RI556_06110 [Hydrogenovibrio sp.]|uniref:hypothetical protein n=1 Tax=Hydrogenovibrio sp. TaxID=2065821 RepID=UPI0028709964|nr:hypothetical protein [Hydrogenovibrio sp.]MDR9498731.1 hypothetical protein [Hydrogenovibrio sp.]
MACLFKKRFLVKLLPMGLGAMLALPLQAEETHQNPVPDRNSTQTHSSADSRAIIWLSPSERAAVLAEMRQFVVASQAILQGVLDENWQTVEDAAREVGVRQMRQTPPGLRDKLPEGFMRLGPKVHRGFENIADEASGLADKTVVLQQLADLQKHCISCHASWQLKARP